jgi:predicted ATPase/class 3 adenylate cyclase
MPICAACDAKNPAHARFCSACGARIEPGERTRFRRVVTVLFVDVVDSTALGERLDPEAVSQVMTAYFEAMSPVVERHGGTVAGLVGDALMAVFGLPALHEDDALRAVRAAQEMRSELVDLNRRLFEEFGVTLITRTGIDTGPVVGTGLAAPRNFVAGEAANTAAALQQRAEPGEILLGEQTWRLVRAAVSTEPVAVSTEPAAPSEPVAPSRPAGEAKPARVHRLLGLRTDLDAVPRRFDVPMLGRERQMARLRAAYRQAVEGASAHLVTVIGAAGLGKSRLAHEFLVSISDGARVLRGRCLPYGEGVAFRPVAEAVLQALEVSGDHPAQARARLEAMLGDEPDAAAIVQGVMGLTGLAGRQDVPDDSLWGWALRRFLEHLAAERPLVLVLDDVQWADPAVLDLVHDVHRRIAGVPLLVLCLARPEPVHDRPGRRSGQVVRLRSLTAEQSRRLVDSLLGGPGLPAPLRARIADASEGNPLFLEQLVSMLIDDGLIVRRGGGWVALEASPRLAIPSSIQALLGARLDRLHPDERQVLWCAAVTGQAFVRDAVEALVPDPVRPRVGRLLAGLVGKEFVRAEPRGPFAGAPEGGAYRFAHQLVRDVAYESIAKTSRAELHEAFAEWLERDDGGAAEAAGYHLEQAYRYRVEVRPPARRHRELAGRAAERLGRAGERAFSRGDVAAASSLLRRAVDLLPADDARRPPLLVQLGEAEFLGGRLDGARAAAAEVLSGQAADERTRTLAELLSVRLGVQTDPLLNWRMAAQTVRRAVDTFESAGDDLGAAEAWRVLSWLYLTECRWETARYAAARALAHARKAGDPRSGRDLGNVARAMLHGLTAVPEALERAEAVLREVRGDPVAEGAALCRLGRVHALQGRFDPARKLIQQGADRLEEVGAVTDAWLNRAGGLGELETLRGDWEAAEREYRRGCEAFESMGERSFLATLAAYRGHCLYLLGRDEEAEAMALLSARAATTADISSNVVWRGVLAKVLARRGRAEDAEPTAREAVELAEMTDMLVLQGDAWVDLAEVLRLAGRQEEAVAALRSALERYGRKQHTVAIASVRRRLAELTARPVTARGA